MQGFTFTVDAKVLAGALADVSRVADRRASVKVLAGARLTFDGGRLIEVAATDQETTITARLDDGQDPEMIVLGGAKDALAVLKTLSGVLTVSGSPDAPDVLTVETQTGGRFTFPAFPAEDFPALPSVPTSFESLTAEAFRAAVQPAVAIASKDYSRPVLCGVYMSVADRVLTVAATDSYRLFTDSRECGMSGTFGPAVVPAVALAEVLRLVKRKGAPALIGIDWTTTHVRLTSGNVEVVARLIDGQFPHFVKLIPDAHDVRLVVSMVADELAAVSKRLVKAVGSLSRKNPLAVARLSVGGDGTVTVSAGESSEVLPTRATFVQPRNADGGELDSLGVFPIGFSPAFLADAASIGAGGGVTVRLISPLRPAVFVNDRGEGVHLLMPIRLAE